VVFVSAVVFCHHVSFSHLSVWIGNTRIQVKYQTSLDHGFIVHGDSLQKLSDTDPNIFSDYFGAGFKISNNGQPCTRRLANVYYPADLNSVIYTFDFDCPQVVDPLTFRAKAFDSLSFRYALFFEIDEEHECLAEIHLEESVKHGVFSKDLHALDFVVEDFEMEGGGTIGSSSTAQKWKKRGSQGVMSKAWLFLKLGVKHILTGYDHILFLAGLLVITLTFGHLVRIITAFTIAHSITLIIASLNIFVLSPRLTESLIALSISYVAFENVFVLRAPRRRGFFANPARRWMLTFFFGLVHGFGFSSVLRELSLPQKGVILSLLSFNVGVEIGQIAIVAALFPLLIFVRQKSWNQKFVTGISVLIGLIGLYWFVLRAGEF